ncbi:unnamed protein product, partial [Laminaria digitata]
MLDPSSAPSFLHQSYQHENVLELCGFTSIANVRPPNTATTTSEENERWLIWVDKRRGLLGRTAVTCPTRIDPPPGRRHTQSLTQRRTVPDSDSTFRRNEGQATRSLSLLTGLDANAKAAAVAAATPVLAETGEYCPKDDKRFAAKDSGSQEDEKTDEGVGCDQSKRPSHVGLEGVSSRLAKESAVYDDDVGNLEPPVNSPSDKACGKVQVLLDGLNRPSRVAAVTGTESKGVFFIDEAAPAEEDDRPIRAASSPQNDAHQGDSCPSGQPTRRVGQVRFLPWGEREAITLVKRLCNPIALCVHGDSSVFVLEEVWETQNNHDGDRQPEGTRKKHYRVCRMGGPELSAWLDNEAKRDTPCRDRAGGLQHNGQRKFFMGAFNNHGVADGTTEIEREAASNSTCGSSKLDRSENSRRRGVVDFVEVLELPVPSESCGHPEQPVDLCVLTDGTIVVAFYNSAPLHSGLAVSENQGAIKAFPITQQACHSDGPRSTETGTTSARSATTTAPRIATTRYSGGEGWLVADGLPVITGIAAGGGRGVYFSLCGAGRDGAVTAIGSLSTARISPALPRPTGFGANDHRKFKAVGDRKGGALASGGIAARGSKTIGGRSGGCGVNFVRVVSGFSAALTVDEDMNLFYLSAENKRACHALWCSVPGACSRRVSFLREVSPTLLVASAQQLSGVPKGGAVVPRDAGIVDSAESYPNNLSEGGRHAPRGKTSQEPAAVTDVAAVNQAAALSAALTEEAQSIRTRGGGRKPLLFASYRPGAVQAKEGSGDEGLEGGGGGGGEAANIVVVSRCRPLLQREVKRGVRAAVFCDGDEVVVSDKALPNSRSRRFGFDRVFGPSTSQARVYAEGVSPVVRKMLDGYNCSVLAYGQTGSGKTFTMEGGLSGYPSPVRGATTDKSRSQNASKVDQAVADDDRSAAVCTDDIGIIPRAVHTIFREGGGGGTRRYWVYVSHMEIYNERLFDLLAPEAGAATPLSPPPSPKRRTPRAAGGAKSPRPTGLGLAIEESRELGVIVKGLTQVEVKSPEEIFAIIARSKSNRRTAETMCNVESSRSHGIFCVRVISAEPTPWGGEITRDGRLSLVDLSGSENIKRSGAVGARAKEAAAIGQSLLALGRVIKALVNGAPHIPYRESKLTRVLGDSLGGNAFTAIILNITPNHGMLDETLNTLLYAKTAQSVRNAPKQHITNKSPSEVAKTGDVASDAQTLGGNAVKEMKLWRGATASRSSPGLSRMHIRPWESKVPIRAFPSDPVPASSHAFDKPHENDDIGEHVRGIVSPFRSRESSGNAPSRVVGRRRGRRPATAGATRSMSGTQGLSHKQHRYPDGRGYAAVGRDVSPAAIGACEPPSDRGLDAAPDDVAHRVISSMSEQQLLRKSGHEPALGHALSDSVLARDTSKGRHSGGGSPTSGKASCREFNSTAAVWVHSVVLEPSHRSGSPKVGLIESKTPSAQGNSSSSENIKLTEMAQRAIEEVFDRYDVEGQGFLPPRGISSIQEIWTRPDAEPPPPRRPTSSSLLRPRRGPGPSTARGSTDKRDMRALPRKSFVEFCRRAAARDAIFIRHLFTRSGYNYRLELPPGTAGAVASAAASAPPPVARTRSAALGEPKPKGDIIQRKKGPNVVTGRAGTRGRDDITRSSSRDLPKRGDSRGGGAKTACGVAARSRSSKGKQMEQFAQFASTQDERGLFGHGHDDTRGLATGVIVDAAELWEWTEDRRDHEERHEQGGLLSRGGGAHVSRVPPGTIVGDFASTSC